MGQPSLPTVESWEGGTALFGIEVNNTITSNVGWCYSSHLSAVIVAVYFRNRFCVGELDRI
jgi:hypothetical protein